MKENPGSENIVGTQVTLKGENENTFTDNVENLEGNEKDPNDVEARLEEEKNLAERMEDGEKADNKKAEELRVELYMEETGEEMDAKKEQAKEALAQIVDSIHEKKLPILKRIEEETHFKDAFPFLSAFGFFGMGRAMAKSMYGKEYESKVAIPEERDENTLIRLNDREMEIEAKIAMLDAGDVSPEDLKELTSAIETLTKQMEDEAQKERKISTEKKTPVVRGGQKTAATSSTDAKKS